MMKIVWDKCKCLIKFIVYEWIIWLVECVLDCVFDYYGFDGLICIGVDFFGGCFNNWWMWGGWSFFIYVFVCVIDFDLECNQLWWGKDCVWLVELDV